MYGKISIISLFALLLVGGVSTQSMVFGQGSGTLSDNLADKYSLGSNECSLPDEVITFSIDKDVYQLGDEIKISGQVIPSESTNLADPSKHNVYVTFPYAKSIFITPLDDRTQTTESSSTYDSDNASSMGQTTSLSILDTSLRIDECGNFETSVKVIPLVFKNGFYVLNIKYQTAEV